MSVRTLNQQMPSWFHGKISRKEAEKRLNENDPEDGLFLIRTKKDDTGYVLSLVVEQTHQHFVIIRETDKKGRPYLTFYTESSSGPEFRSLPGVVQYLIKTPGVLPVQLIKWVPATEVIFMEGGLDSFLSSKFTDALFDAINDVDHDYEYCDDTLEPNIEFVDMPKFKITRGGSVSSSASGLSGRESALVENEIITPVSTNTLQDGSLAVICTDQNGQTLAIPYSSDITVVPILDMGQNSENGGEMTDKDKVKARKKNGLNGRKHHSQGPQRSGPAPAPAPPPRSMRIPNTHEKATTPPAGKGAKYDKSKTHEMHFTPSLPARPPPENKVPTKPSDDSDVPLTRGYERFTLEKEGPKGSKVTADAHPSPTGEIYREVLMEGTLKKLPQDFAKSKATAWRNRMFKLVITISEETAIVGPVLLEYYEKEKFRGQIELGNVIRICPLEESDLVAPALKKPSKDLLFKIVTKNRTYPLYASSPKDRATWMNKLNETLGLTTAGNPVRKHKRSASNVGEDTGDFVVKCLTRTLPISQGMMCIREKHLSFHNNEEKILPSNLVESWHLSDLRAYGFVRQVVWFEAGQDSSVPGVLAFTSPDAEKIWEIVSRNVRSLNSDNENKGGRTDPTRMKDIGWHTMYTESNGKIVVPSQQNQSVKREKQTSDGGLDDIDTQMFSLSRSRRPSTPVYEEPVGGVDEDEGADYTDADESYNEDSRDDDYTTTGVGAAVYEPPPPAPKAKEKSRMKDPDSMEGFGFGDLASSPRRDTRLSTGTSQTSTSTTGYVNQDVVDDQNKAIQAAIAAGIQKETKRKSNEYVNQETLDMHIMEAEKNMSMKQSKSNRSSLSKSNRSSFSKEDIGTTTQQDDDIEYVNQSVIEAAKAEVLPTKKGYINKAAIEKHLRDSAKTKKPSVDL
eukprot:m.76363 g.76363  ORF g.76363 m.76363 type:complete len:907 (+) comp12553_c0_seq1:327-3047(+)